MVLMEMGSFQHIKLQTLKKDFSYLDSYLETSEF